MTRAMREAIKENERMMENKAFARGFKAGREGLNKDQIVYALHIIGEMFDRGLSPEEMSRELTNELCSLSAHYEPAAAADKMVVDEKINKFVKFGDYEPPSTEPDPLAWMYE